MATMTIEVDGFDFSSAGPVVTNELLIEDPCYTSYKITVDPNEASSSSVWLTWENLINSSTSFNVSAYHVERMSVGGVAATGFVSSGLQVDSISEFKITMRASEGAPLRTGYLQPSAPTAFKISFQANFSETSSTVEGFTQVSRRGYLPCALIE